MPLQADSVMVGRAVPKQIRAVSLMIWFLSKSSDLGMAYVLSRGQEYDLGDVDLHSKASVALFMVSWLAEASVRNALHAGLSSMENQGRMVADQFLMHSLLMEFIVAQNRKGVALDLTSLIAKYIRLWTHRPIPDVIKRRLAKLVWQPFSDIPKKTSNTYENTCWYDNDFCYTTTCLAPSAGFAAS